MPATAMTNWRRVDYDDHQYRVYSRARPLLPENAERWGAIFRRHVPAGATIVDVGSGTGIYTALLADSLGAEVVGVEPSTGMRSVAEAEQARPGVRYLAGRAEALPLADASCDAALLSNVIHHIEDLPAAAGELRRVLRPGGVVLARGALRDRLRRMPHFEYFPEALEIAIATSPRDQDAIDTITSAGFEEIARERVEQLMARSLSEFADKLALRAISHLELLDDDLFEAGLRRLREAAAAETEPTPVMETMDLVVFRRSPSPDS
jgi:ubiquinone/menaquinone biosynthesis C-methylase UbiE